MHCRDASVRHSDCSVKGEMEDRRRERKGRPSFLSLTQIKSSIYLPTAAPICVSCTDQLPIKRQHTHCTLDEHHYTTFHERSWLVFWLKIFVIFLLCKSIMYVCMLFRISEKSKKATVTFCSHLYDKPNWCYSILLLVLTILGQFFLNLKFPHK